MVAALARAGDPDLAVRSLHRLVEALDGADAVRRLGRGAAGPAARVGPAAHPAARRPRRQRRARRPPRRPPGRLDGARRRRRRHPARPGRRRRSSSRCWRRSAPIPTTRRGACGWARRPPTPRRRGSPRCGSPTGGRSCRWPAATWARGCRRGGRRRARRHRRRRAHRGPGAAPWPSSRPTPPPAGWRSSAWASAAAGSSTTSATSTSSSSPSRSTRATRERRAGSATRVAAALMRICREAAWEVDAALRPEGKAGAAGAHPGRPPGLLRAVGQHLGVPGAAEDAPGRRRPRPRAAATSTRSGRWSGRPATGPGFVAEVQAMRRRVEDNIPPAQAERELKLGRGGLRDVEFAVQLLQLVHGRVDASLRVGGTLPALTALSAGGYVGRDDAATLIASYRFLRTVEHRLQLLRLRRTHLLPTDDAAAALAGPVAGLQARRPRATRSTCCAPSWTCTPARCAGCTRSSSTGRCCRAVARVPGEQLQLGSAGGRRLAAGARLRRPRGARCGTSSALTGGVSRSASMQKYLLPVLLQTFASCPNPDAGLLAYRQVSEALGGNQWFLRLLRDEGQVAERLAQLLGLQPVRRRAAHPDAGGAAAARRRRAARAAHARRRWPAPGGQAAGRAAGSAGGHRGCCAGCAARSCCGSPSRRPARPAGRRRASGEALTDIAVATLQVGLDVALRAHAAEAGIDARRRPDGPRGHRHGPARRRRDGLRLRRRRPVRAPGPGRARTRARRRGRGQRRGAHAAPAARRARARPRLRGRRRPAAGGPAGRAGPQPVGVPRVLRALGVGLGGAGAAARRAGRRRRGARRGVRRADRPDPLPGRRADRRAGRRDPPDQGPGGAGAAAARRRPGHPHQAGPRRPGRRRVDGAAAPAAARRRAAGAAGARRRSTRWPRSATAGLLDAEQLEALRAAWELATRARNAIFLVRGPAQRPAAPARARAGRRRPGLRLRPGHGRRRVPRRLPAHHPARARRSSSTSSTARPAAG